MKQPFKFKHYFRTDLDQLLSLWRRGKPFAFSRFADGELAILEGREIGTADGWKVPPKDSDFTKGLGDALNHYEPGYLVGISSYCCDPEAFRKYSSLLAFSHHHVTFSNLLVNGNHEKWCNFILNERPWYTIVSCGFGNYRLPPNVVNDQWDIDELVNALCDERRPILVAAGPAANIIIHKYWIRQKPNKRQIIVDVGSSLDAWIWAGKVNRGYWSNRQLRTHCCRWPGEKDIPLYVRTAED